MVNKSRKLGWIASGVLAAALFAAASPAQAWDGFVRRGFAPRVGRFHTSRVFFPRARFSRFYRPYAYAYASPYYYDDYYYAAGPYYYGSPYYYAGPYVYARPYVSFGVRRSFGHRAVFRGHFRGRW
jgi:hypothetical protein